MIAQIRTLIADDEPAARDAMAQLLAEDPEIDLVAASQDGPATLAAIRSHEPHLVFLDVQMPGCDGFAVLRQLQGVLPAVVFVTAHDRHALQAFDAHAVDYLLKPYDDERFHTALARAKQRVRAGRLGEALRPLLEGLAHASSPRPRIMVRKDGRVTVIDARDIDWVEADGDSVRIHVGKMIHVKRDTLTAFEQLLDPVTFVRVHRSTIVNVERIVALEPYFKGEWVLILQDGAKLKLSRQARPRLAAALGRDF
jgi:two-component system LytT family response regulator